LSKYNFSKKAINAFLEKAFELAYGDNAIEKAYTMEEVIERLEYFSNRELKLQSIEELINE
jgi:hypothetical protein